MEALFNMYFKVSVIHCENEQTLNFIVRTDTIHTDDKYQTDDDRA